MKIGIAGFGKMGAAMAARLAETGATVMVWNRSAERAHSAGFTTAESPGALAEANPVVISSLFDDEAVKSVYSGPDGLLAGAKGTLFIEMSTVLPDTQRSIAKMARDAGGAFIECPVGGTTGPARAGQLVGLAGGDAVDVEAARPVLEKLCRRLEHVGSIGDGATTKLAVNLPLIAFWQSFGEAMALMGPVGKSPAWLVGLFSDTAGAAAVMKVKAGAIEATLGGEDSVEPTFDINAMRKDLKMMLESARLGGFPLPVAQSVLSSLDEVAAEGWGQRDCAWVPAFWASKGKSDATHLVSA